MGIFDVCLTLPLNFSYGLTTKISGRDTQAPERKKAKNLYSLCINADVDQSGISMFVRTQDYLAGKGPKPARPKSDIYFSAAAKLIQEMGGTLVFPWDKDEGVSTLEIERLEKELAKEKAKNHELEKRLFACESVRDEYKELVRAQLGASRQSLPDAEQNKNVA